MGEPKYLATTPGALRGVAIYQEMLQLEACTKPNRHKGSYHSLYMTMADPIWVSQVQ